MVRNSNTNSKEFTLPSTTPPSLDRAGVLHPTAAARSGAQQRTASFKRSGGKRRSPEAREKRYKNLLAYHRRLVSRKGLPHSHLNLEHCQAGNFRKCLGQEFEKLAGVKEGGPGGWLAGSQAGPGGCSTGSQAGPGGLSRWSQADSGGWSSTGSHAGPWGRTTGFQAGPGGLSRWSQTGPGLWSTGSQAGPGMCTTVS